MKLLTAQQIREADQFTVQNEPVASIDLMERAAKKCTGWIIKNFTVKNDFKIFTGPGNNGGDGLAIARQLADKGFNVEVYQLMISDKLSKDLQVNRQRLIEQNKAALFEIRNEKDFPPIHEDSVIIDAIFGSGLSRSVDGLALQMITKINKLKKPVISIDIPSGLFSESNLTNNPESIIKAHYTLTFQVPKISFFIPPNDRYTGKWEVLDIGLSRQAIDSSKSDYYLITGDLVKHFYKSRAKFSHKGNYGHALLIAGSYGKMGAAVLSARACLKTGCGLLTVHVPKEGVNVLQTALPEAMVSPDASPLYFSEVPELSAYSAIGIGPGIGTNKETLKAFMQLISNLKIPLIIDADGLNLLAENRELLHKLPENCVLTPHPKEFERLAGKTPGDFEKLRYLSDFAKNHKCYLIYKEAYSKIACPDGKLFINSTGNPGMATAGSGDTLTGIILSLLAQGYSSEQASTLGVYIHGLAGDIYADEFSEESLIAEDIINNLGNAFKQIKFDV